MKKFVVTDQPTERAKNMYKRYGVNIEDYLPALFLVNTDSEEYTNEMANIKDPSKDIPFLNEYLTDNFSPEERESLKSTKYFYEIAFEKPGGLVMPILAEITYADGGKENKYYPAEIWRFNDKEVKKVIVKPVVSVTISGILFSRFIIENPSWSISQIRNGLGCVIAGAGYTSISKRFSV